MTKYNTKNLIPFNARTEDELREFTKKGGIKSGEARREKKLLKTLARTILGTSVQMDKLEMLNPFLKSLATKSKISLGEAVIMAQVVFALRGNAPSAVFLRDTAGEKPVEQIEIAETDGILESQINERLEQIRESYRVSQETTGCDK